MMTVPCPLCGSLAREPLVDTRDLLMDDATVFHYVRCSSCGLCYLNPQPTAQELEAHYPPAYAPFAEVSASANRLHQRLVNHGIRKRIRAIERCRPSGRLLEVGCADGFMLAALRQTGRWEVMGIDTSSVAVARAREMYDLEIIQAPVEQAQLPRGHFDVVAMWDVIEHLPDPVAALNAIQVALRPGGLLILRLPVSDAWDARLFGEAWAGWDAPRHLVVYSMAHLQQVLCHAGLELRASRGNASLYSGLKPSLGRWARLSLHGRSRAVAEALLGSSMLQAMVAPLSWLTSRLWPTSCRLAVAVKPQAKPGDCSDVAACPQASASCGTGFTGSWSAKKRQRPA